MLSFEVEDDGKSEVLEVIFNEEGLSTLLAQLQFIKDRRTDHFHLFAESWGGYDLNEEAVAQGSKPFRQVNVRLTV